MVAVGLKVTEPGYFVEMSTLALDVEAGVAVDTLSGSTKMVFVVKVNVLLMVAGCEFSVVEMAVVLVSSSELVTSEARVSSVET